MWISVKDKLPLAVDPDAAFEAIEVLVSDGDDVQVADFARGGGHIGQPWASWSMYSNIPASYITHWMYKPEPPKRERQDEHL